MCQWRSQLTHPWNKSEGEPEEGSQSTGAVNPAPAPAPRGPDCRLVLGRGGHRGFWLQTKSRDGRGGMLTAPMTRADISRSAVSSWARLSCRGCPGAPLKLPGVGRPRHPRGRWPRGKQPPNPPDRRKRAQGLRGWPAIESQRCPTHCPRERIAGSGGSQHPNSQRKKRKLREAV